MSDNIKTNLFFIYVTCIYLYLYHLYRVPCNTVLSNPHYSDSCVYTGVFLPKIQVLFRSYKPNQISPLGIRLQLTCRPLVLNSKTTCTVILHQLWLHLGFSITLLLTSTCTVSERRHFYKTFGCPTGSLPIAVTIISRIHRWFESGWQ